MQKEDDAALIRRVAAGESDALGPLFERHHERIHSLCYRLTGDAAAADDLVQESFLRVLRKSASFDGRSSFYTWVYRIARNACLDYLSLHKRREQKMQIVKVEMDHERKASEPPEHPKLDRLRRALYSLPPGEREVLVLSRYQGLSYAEIATVCETTVGAVKVRAHRALRELRKIFDELEQQHEV